jgi:hypothetical protein
VDPGVHVISDQNHPSCPELTEAGAFSLEFLMTVFDQTHIICLHILHTSVTGFVDCLKITIENETLTNELHLTISSSSVTLEVLSELGGN